tara:strand:- start:122 stop:688 length:567 start_codon:yes stop_codon:yes gene_type:complete
MNYPFKFFNKKLLKAILPLPLLTSLLPFEINSAKAALEFQWDKNSGYKSLKWFQTSAEKNYRNKIFLFFKPNDRKTGLLSINLKIPKRYNKKLKRNNITFCKAKIGAYTSKSKCIEKITSDIVLNKETQRIEIYPISPVPSDKDTYAIVLKINNPQRSGIYQFHSFGKSSGPVPVSSYIGSWTVTIDP